MIESRSKKPRAATAGLSNFSKIVVFMRTQSLGTFIQGGHQMTTPIFMPGGHQMIKSAQSHDSLKSHGKVSSKEPKNSKKPQFSRRLLKSCYILQQITSTLTGMVVLIKVLKELLPF